MSDPLISESPKNVKRITVSEFGKAVYEVKKSRFIGYCKPVLTAQEANEFVDEIRKQHSDARHNVYAWILKKETSLQKYSDDGEPSGTAGLPVMSVLTKNEVTDCAIVVTRYFGGILLGKGGLVRAYTRAASMALKEAKPQILELCSVMKIELDYSSADKMIFEIRNRGYEIDDIEYGAGVTIRINVPVLNEENFCAFVTDTSNGKSEAVKIGTTEAPTGKISIDMEDEEEE